jgi:signal transduction histidine kinase/ligand-binding sensor domain-containing protein
MFGSPERWKMAAVVGIAILFPASMGAQRYSFAHYGVQDGLDRLNTRAMLQDREGFLWVGTGGGLYRFDGGRFRFYGVEQGLPDTRIRSLHLTRDGVLWVGTSRGLAFRANGGFQAVVIGPPAGPVVAHQGGIVSDSQGTLWVGTNRGLLKGPSAPDVERRFSHVPLPAEGNQGVFGLHIDRDGVLWMGCGVHVCGVAPDGKVLSLGDEAGLPREEWRATLTDSEGNLWVRSRQRLFVRRKGALRFVPMDQGLPRSKEVASLALNPDGALVAPTYLGVYTRRGNDWTRLDAARGLMANAACCVLWDHEGSPWIGLESFGVARWLGYREWEHWTDAEGITANSVMAIARDSAGALWVGTESGLNRMQSGGRGWSTWTRKDGLPDDEVRSLAAGPDGSVWVGSGQGGLARAAAGSGELQRIGAAQGLADDRIVFLSVDRSSTLWAGTRGGLFKADLKRSPVRFDIEPLPGGSPSATIYRVVEAADGARWAAGPRGLFRQEGGVWKAVDVPLRHRSLTFLSPGVRANELWIGYAGVRGISRLLLEGTSARAVHFTERDFLHSDDISFLDTDSRGWTWVGTDHGLDVFDGAGWRHYSQEDGLLWDDMVLGAFMADRDGSVWMGTQRGLSHFMPRRGKPATQPLSARILSVQLGARSADPTFPGKANPAERTLRVAFTALTFRASRAVSFRYRLLGLNDDWIETDQRNAVFPNLGPGSYVLEVAARDPVSGWSPEPARWMFEVMPAPRETWWFRVLLGVLALFLLRAFWRRREQRLLAVQQRLELAVKERTQQLEFEKSRTEAEKATVEQQKQEIERLLTETREASRLKSEFLANVGHEIRTPMNGVLGMTGLALDTELTAEQREYLEAIRAAGNSLLQLLNDILDFSKIEAGRLELEDVAFPARTFLEEIMRTFLYAAREKGVELRLEVDPRVPETWQGDPVRLRQVLVNLLSNAMKFTAAGSVTLRVTPRESGLAQFSVIDTGIGIPANLQGLIFDPFRQADGSTTRKYGGTGLGLAICARLVPMMGGTIWVESEPGRGSDFNFTARLLAAPEASEPGVSMVNGATRISAAPDEGAPKETAQNGVPQDEAAKRKYS